MENSSSAATCPTITGPNFGLSHRQIESVYNHRPADCGIRGEKTSGDLNRENAVRIA
jgi:hypothetical protein